MEALKKAKVSVTGGATGGDDVDDAEKKKKNNLDKAEQILTSIFLAATSFQVLGDTPIGERFPICDLSASKVPICACIKSENVNAQKKIVKTPELGAEITFCNIF